MAGLQKTDLGIKQSFQYGEILFARDAENISESLVLQAPDQEFRSGHALSPFGFVDRAGAFT
jgi:hypothetical protein